MATEFERAMRLMRSRNPQTAEDGFHILRAVAADHLDEMIEAYERETHHGLRCWLLELIGCHARSERALPTLTAALHGEDESLRDWAIRGLRAVDTKEARRLLWQWEQNQPGLVISVHNRLP